jgi:hypothetical protein
VAKKNSNLKHHAYELLVLVYDKEEDALVPNVKIDQNFILILL